MYKCMYKALACPSSLPFRTTLDPCELSSWRKAGLRWGAVGGGLLSPPTPNAVDTGGMGGGGTEG